MRSSRFFMGSLVLALGCGGGDSDKKRADSGTSDGGDNGNTNGNGSSSGEGGMSGADSSSNGASGDASESCGASPFGAEPVKVNMLVLLDRSGSMNFNFDANTVRWPATKASLSSALSAVQNEIAFGLQLFPSGANCVMPGESDPLTVPLAAGTQTVPAIAAALEAASPGGGTPTAAALSRALSYFTGAELEGERYVLLVTDGGPGCNTALSCDASSCMVHMEGRCDVAKPLACCSSNCCDPNPNVGGVGAQLNCLNDTETLGQIQALRTAGISTFVVGIPGSEAFADYLDAFAVAGGVPNAAGPKSYFAVDAPAALTTVLSSITKSLVTSCRLQLASMPPALDQLNVKVEGEIIPRGGVDGWDLDESTDPPTVVIQGASCARIESMGVESVEVVYGCPTVVIL